MAGTRRNSFSAMFPELASAFVCREELELSRGDRVIVWQTKDVDYHADIERSLLSSPLVEFHIQEADIQGYRHILTVLEWAKSGQDARRYFVFVSLGIDNPRLLAWDSARLLLVGAYSTVYGFEMKSLKNLFRIICWGGGTISDIRLLLGEKYCAAVCETNVRAFLPSGAVVWATEIGDLVRIKGEEQGILLLEPYYPDGRVFRVNCGNGHWAVSR